MLGEILGGIGGIVSSIFGNSKAEKQAEKQAQLQKEFAQNAVQWKVADATKAGIHPLYALGANTTSYQPISVGTSTPDFAGIGQNLGRAIDASRDSNERQDGFDRTVRALQLQKMGLENDLLASQLRVVNQPGHPPGQAPARLIPGQGSTPQVMSNPALTINVNPKNTKAEDAEAQYGEIGGELIGLPSLIDDVLTTYTGAGGPNELGANLRKQLIPFLRQYGPVSKPARQKSGNTPKIPSKLRY